MATENIIEDLIVKFSKLPTLGRKSATKIVYKLLSGDKQQAVDLVQLLQKAQQQVTHCKVCNTLTEHSICQICRNTKRLATGIVTIVSDPQDINTIEQLGIFDGVYFVLNGLVNPLQGINGEQAGLPKLIRFIQYYQITEVILALNTSQEGETTATIIHDICDKLGITCMRFATGIPAGSSFQNLDANTILQAFLNRTKVD